MARLRWLGIAVACGLAGVAGRGAVSAAAGLGLAGALCLVVAGGRPVRARAGRAALVALGAAAGVAFEAWSWREHVPLAVDVALGTTLPAFVVLGALGGRAEALAAVASFGLAVGVEQTWVFVPPQYPDGCDPFCDNPDVGLVLVVPLVLLLIGLGALLGAGLRRARRLRLGRPQPGRRRRRRRSSPPRPR